MCYLDVQSEGVGIAGVAPHTFEDEVASHDVSKILSQKEQNFTLPYSEVLAVPVILDSGEGGGETGVAEEKGKRPGSSPAALVPAGAQPVDRSQQNDSLQYVVIGTEMLKMPRNLKKHGLFMPISGKTVYNYSVSTFMPKNFVTDEFIPLVLYTSAYLDKDNHLVSESSTAVPADLQADFIRRSPHYYVIGATFKEDFLQK